MSGYTLSQPHGKGDLFQQTIYPGQWDGLPPIPATGDYSCKPGNMDRWRLVAVTFTLTTDSTVQNRYVQIQYPTGTMGAVAFDYTGYIQVKSLAVAYSGSIHSFPLADTYTSPSVNFRLSGMFREAGQGLVIHIVDAHANDALSAIAFTVDRTPVVPDNSQQEWARVLEERVE